MTESPPHWRRAARAVLTAAFACGVTTASADDKTTDPYIVTIDTRPWIEALRSDDLFETDPAIDSLASLGDHAVPALAAALRAEGTLVRVNIVEVLRDIGTPATAAPLLLAAADGDIEVRRGAVEALGKLGDERGRAVVEAALDDDAPEVVRTAAIACRSLCRSPAALRRLVELSVDANAAAGARASLRQLARDPGLRAIIDPLIAEVALPVLREGTDDRRIHAALVVADTGDRAALPVLRACALGPVHPLITAECVQSTAAIPGDDATANLAQISRTGGPVARRAACEALATLAPRSEAARGAHQGCPTPAPGTAP